jgi:predicted ribosomally synthesized peptide with nif11-like leader
LIEFIVAINDVIPAFLREAASNPSLAERLSAASSAEEVLAIAADHGFQISLEEARQSKQSGVSELADGELEAIAGGTTEWGTAGPTCWA